MGWVVIRMKASCQLKWDLGERRRHQPQSIQLAYGHASGMIAPGLTDIALGPCPFA